MSNFPASLSWAHPLVSEWFIKKFGTPTEPQVKGWPSILAGEATLISAPTGSGKTLTAFLVSIDQLVRSAIQGNLRAETQLVYVSPLKALSNDIQKNLLTPLSEIMELAAAKGIPIQEISVAVRTGDTLAKDRVKMLKKPPHILVTTPESFYILLTAEKSRAILSTVHTVIVDEIHALANNKRGAHLCLSLERLAALTINNPIRIGLSATQKPLSLIGRFLVGNDRPLPVIVDIGYGKQLDIRIEIPQTELSAVASNEMWDEIYDRIAALVAMHRSTLIFVNTRRLAERVAHHLAERIGEDKVAAHHGSLSRKIRLEVETKLKQGELSALVATASLELGIDIGAIDLVCQIGSPRSIAVGLQRIGRSGHWRGAVSKGRIFATTRDELLENAALVKAINEGDLDHLLIPKEPIDILAQQIIAASATQEWKEDDLYQWIKKAYHYNYLSRDDFNELLEILSDGISGSRSRYFSYLFRDRVNGRIKARRHARLAAITSGGAIPDNALFTVVLESEGVTVGTLDEDFAIESHRGDIILLGTTSWIIKRIESATGRVIVENAHGAPPSIPFWQGEAPARTDELSLQVSSLRETLAKLSTTEAMSYLQKHCGVSEYAARQIVDYIQQAKKVLGAIPSQQCIIAERFFDESGGMQLIIHAPFGARINKAWGLALRKRFCRSFNFELQAAATDDGINISLTEQHSFPLGDVFQFLNAKTAKEVLLQAVLQSPLFGTRWRWDATRSLAVPRFRNGKKVPPNIVRMLAEDLLAAVFPDAAACQDNLAGKDIELPHHPLINETVKDALTEALDVEGFIELLQKIQNEQITCLAVDTPIPSPLAHEILNANPYAFLDDAPLEERRARAVEMRQTLADSALLDLGKLDAAAIQEVQQQAWPDIRNSDELHYVLQVLVIYPENMRLRNENHAFWNVYAETLFHDKRLGKAEINHAIYWFTAEKANLFKKVYPEAIILQAPAELSQQEIEKEDALLTVLRGWLSYLGPVNAENLANELKLSLSEIENALLKLETTGFVMRGAYIAPNKVEWCERHLLARIHRLTMQKLRKEIAAVSADDFYQWLLHWQHLAPNTQLSGEQGLLEIIKQLQGFEIAANVWEPFIFKKRMKDYSPYLLDHLCLSGIIGWGRVSSHPALGDEERVRRIYPTSVAPITFFIREDASWILANNTPPALTNLSFIAKEIYEYITSRGASFLSDIVRDIKHLKVEVETALWELVAAGLVTADGFDNLRAMIDPARRLGRRRRILPRQGSGRWAILPCNTINQAEQVNKQAWMLLHRYGVVFRDLIAREKLKVTWQELLRQFRQLEARGEIRGGRFVSGFQGEQFALPYALESLRMRKKGAADCAKIVLSTADPLNLQGIILPGKKISATSRRIVTLSDPQ